MNKKGLFITLIVAVSMAVFLLGKFEKVDAASNLLENKESGDVVKFAGVEWVLLNPSERYIVMKDYWLKDGKQVTAPFNTKKTNKFDPSQKENIGYILNTEYYNTLSNIEKGMVVESVWDISPFLGVGIQTVRAKIGLLSLREWLEYKSVLGNPSWVFWTLTPHPQNNEQVFAIGADGNSYAWSTWKPEWPTVTHPALKLKPGVFVNPLTSELQPLEDDNNPPTISFEPNGNTTKQKVHSTKVWVYDWFGSGVEEATYRWKKGNQYVTGNIRMNEYPMIINTPDNGDGEYYLEVTAVDAAGNRSSQVSKPFVVGSLEVTSVNPLADISVDYGTTRSALPLPSTVQVTLSDQSIRSLGVTWDDGTPVYDGNTAGEYTFTGTLSQDVSNPQGLTAEVKVIVHPKPAEPPIVSSVESLNDIEVSYGTERSALPLPPTVLVILSDQTSQSLGVTWDDGTPVYDGNAAGEYTFTGTLSQDVSNPQGLTAEVKVVVHPKPAEPPVVSSVESLNDIEVSYGTERSALPLPPTVLVILSDQTSQSLGVTWDDGTPVYDGNAAGEYTFTGTLGTERSALPLPPTVLVILSDQTSQSLGVTWDDGSPAYNGNTVGEYTFTGTLAQDVSNPQGLTAKVKMVVRPFEPDTEAPQWPDDSELTVSDVTQTSVKLSWPSATDNVGVTGYRIYVDDFEYKTAGGNENALIVNDLTAETSYTFKVTAYDEAGNESAGLTASAKTLPQPTEPDTEAPQWPDGSELMVSDVTQTSVKLSWPSATDNVGVTGYRIYVDDFEYKTAGGSENAIIVTGLTAKTSYMFKVTAHDEAGNESAALSVSAKTLPQPTEPDTEAPQWPDGSELMVSDVTQTSVKLSWPSATDNVGVTGYRIYVDDVEYKTAGGSENAIIVTGLTVKTSYMFKVTAHDEAGNESATLSASAKTLPQPMEPDTEAPRWPDGSELTVSDITQTSVKLTWPSAIDNVGVTGYRIYVDEVEYKAVGGNVKGTMINGLATNTSYTFKVTAYDAVGNESTSLSKQATTAQSSSGGGGTGGSGSGGGRVLSSNADLQELQVWDKDKKLELSPSFAAGTTSFTARTQAEQVEIMVKPVHFAAKVMLKEKEITDRTKEHLEEGDNTFVLTVQAENGTKKKYTLTIYRETPKPYEPVIEFTDIAGHWAENHIKRAAAKGIVSGYPDGTFQPNHPVTRAEFTVMLTGALRLEEKGAALTFNDNDQIGAWAKQAVAQAVQAGIIDGYEDGSFRPNASVTRAEMAVMVAQAIKRPLKAHTTTGFVDDEAIPQWAKGSVEAIRGLSIVSGRAGNKFVPNDTMTRAEAATILLRMVDILK